MGSPTISEDVASDPRFDPEEIVREHGVISSANAIIRGRGEPFGTLQVDSTTRQRFTWHDIDFLLRQIETDERRRHRTISVMKGTYPSHGISSA